MVPRGRGERLRPAARGLLVAHGLAAMAMAAPWPVLLLAVWNETGSGSWVGIVGASRLAPYVALSWLAGRIADRVERGRLVELSTIARAVMLGVSALALAEGSVAGAVACATFAVAAGTPAFPAVAAALPRTEGHLAPRATSLLVTIEVGAFVAGPAAAGVVLGLGPGSLVIAGAALATVAAVPLLHPWSHGPSSASDPTTIGRAPVGLRLLLTTPAALSAVVVVALVNAVVNLLTVCLLPLTAHEWSGTGSFGIATAVLGVGALGAPILFRLLGGLLSAPALLALAVPLLVVGLSGGPWSGLPALALVGAASVQLEAVTTTVIQAAVPPSQAAGVLGLTDSLMVGAGVVGALVAPLMAQPAGTRAALVLAGLAVAAVAPAFSRRRLVRDGGSGLT